MIKDCSIFFDRTKLRTLRQLIRNDKDAKKGVENWTEEVKKVHEEVKSLLQLKECAIILKKYSSKLDLEHFKAQF